MADHPRDSFSEACGLAGPLRVWLEGPGSPGPTPLAFHHPYLVVGRDPRADVTIDGADVSRRHAYFQVVAGRVFCVDLGSRTGVRWADGPRPVGWVDPGEGVGLGPVQVRFEGGEAGQGGNLPVSHSSGWPSLTDARLEFPGAEPSREAWQISRALVLIGRSPTCRVRLLGPGVGRIHAAIVRTPAGVWVVDLLGPGGVLVGGMPMRSGRLEDGDEIGLGDHRIRVRIGQMARSSGRTELTRSTSNRGMRPASGLGTVGGGQIGAGRELPAPPDAATARLLDEFDRMHQRTTEQFQQAILMMFRMHQDQMDLFRGELSRIDRLEDEQRALQAELARGNLERPQRLALRLVSGGPSPPIPHAERAKPGRSHPVPIDAPGWTPPDAPAPDVSPPPESAPTIAGLQQAAGVQPSPRVPDPHSRLARRIAEIQSERQGLWKRILASLGGDNSERSIP